MRKSVLNEKAIAEVLRTRRFGRILYTFRTIDSTNAFAKSLAARGGEEGALVVAEHQTCGRGRWGRTWESRPGKGILFSLLLRPDPRSDAVPQLTLLAATSVALVLENRFGLDVKLRWPNDVTVADKGDLPSRAGKVAGVLAEAQRGSAGVSYAVLGIGVNVRQRPSDFSDALRSKATSLDALLGEKVDRVALLAELVLQLETDYLKLQSEGVDFVLDRWMRRNAMLGRSVTLKTAAGLETGTVLGFHADGRLVLSGPDGRNRRFADGEVIEVHHASGY